MNRIPSRPLRAEQVILVGLLATVGLPVCAAGPKTQPAPSQTSDAASAQSASHADRKPPGTQAGRKTVVRQPDEQLDQLAGRILPSGAETITKPLELDFPPLGKVILILYQLSSEDPGLVSDPSIYRGWVLVPDEKQGTYRIEPLPSQKDGAATLMYQVQSVFAADADGDGAPELCILSEITEAGGGKSYADTDLFKWSGSRFTVVKQSDRRPLYNLRTAKAVRDRLKKMRPRSSN